MNFECAAFCFEELILSDPRNYLFHVLLAEAAYSQGDMATATKSGPVWVGNGGGGGGGGEG